MHHATIYLYLHPLSLQGNLTERTVTSAWLAGEVWYDDAQCLSVPQLLGFGSVIKRPYWLTPSPFFGDCTRDPTISVHLPLCRDCTTDPTISASGPGEFAIHLSPQGPLLDAPTV